LNISIVHPAADATRDVHASPNKSSEDLAANASLNSAKLVSGLADVLAIAGEEPDAVRQGYASPCDVIDVSDGAYVRGHAAPAAPQERGLGDLGGARS
jgi:hypothetical protein